MNPWTPANIPDQTGRLALITGSNSGIGFSAARELARHGARVILGCRNAAKAQAAKSRIENEVRGARLEVGELDLSNLGSIRTFAKSIVDRAEPLDMLINNAAVMAMPTRQTTVDGFELQFGTNHLGHFALTGLLLSALLRSPAARIVTISSIAHKSAVINFDDLQAEKRYDPWSAYRQSKLANLMFGLELNRRLEQAHLPAISLVAHPGLAKTSIIQNGPGSVGGFGPRFMQAAFAVLAQSADRGALPMLFAATSIEAKGGEYYGPGGLFEWRGYPAKAKTSEAARDTAAARKLWEISEALVGVEWEME